MAILMRKLMLITTVALILISCANLAPLDIQQLQAPKVNLIGLKLTELNLAAQKFLVKLQLNNPNVQGISINGIDLAVAINGKELARGATTNPLTLTSRGTSTVEIAAVANALSLLEQGLRLMQNKPLEYTINGNLSVLPGIFSWVKLPLSYKGSVTLQQLRDGISTLQLSQ